VKRIDVTKQGKSWVAKTGSGEKVAGARTKEAIVKKTAAVAKKAPGAVTVKIHKVDGKIQEERTYPRSADPKSSKG
jgi:hypothetical protein